MSTVLRSLLRSEAARDRWGVASRVLAAAAGGYALTALATAVLALLLPLAGMSRPEAVLAATLASFTFYVMAVLWAFIARTALRAWLGLAGAAVLPGAAWMAVRGLA